MNIDNRLSLIGHVFGFPKRAVSPNGAEHCKFYLQHRSNQIEAGMTRNVWCNIAVQISENSLVIQSQAITNGSKILVVGFIHSHKTSNGLNQLVLHAKKIEFID